MRACAYDATEARGVPYPRRRQAVFGSGTFRESRDMYAPLAPGQGHLDEESSTGLPCHAEIAGSARKHGVPDEDIAHAVRNPVRLVAGDGRTLVIGADRTGRLLEVVVLDDDPDEDPVIIHAMALRAKFRDYLR